MRSSVCIAYLLVPGPVAGHTKGRLAEAAGEGPGPGVLLDVAGELVRSTQKLDNSCKLE